jgi:hypothetical protein
MPDRRFEKCHVAAKNDSGIFPSGYVRLACIIPSILSRLPEDWGMNRVPAASTQGQVSEVYGIVRRQWKNIINYVLRSRQTARLERWVNGDSGSGEIYKLSTRCTL